VINSDIIIDYPDLLTINRGSTNYSEIAEYVKRLLPMKEVIHFSKITIEITSSYLRVYERSKLYWTLPYIRMIRDQDEMLRYLKAIKVPDEDYYRAERVIFEGL